MNGKVIYWIAELGNYLALAFWGQKLFIKKYNIQLNKNVWVENVIVVLTSLLLAVISVGNYAIVVYSNPVTYMLVLCMYVILKIFSKGKIKRSLVLIAVYVNFMRLIDLWVVTVILEVNRVSRYVSWDLIHMGPERSIFMFCLTVCYYAIYRWLDKNPVFDYLYENRFYRWAICIFSFLGIICFYRVYRFDYTEYIIEYWILYLICAFIVFGIFLFYMIRNKEEERAKMLKMRNDLMETNYRVLQKAYDENHMLYHDYKNHMMAVSVMIEEKENEKALEYIRAYMDLASDWKRRVCSGCRLVDIIMNCKAGEARDKVIDFKYKIDFIGSLPLEDIDICALLANLLDNAIEACEKVTTENPWIKFRMYKRNDTLLIRCMNRVRNEDVLKTNFFKSDKKNEQIHGWGMKSIENVIKKYDGYKEYEVGDGVVEIFISIPLGDAGGQKSTIGGQSRKMSKHNV